MRILSIYYTHKPGGFCKRLYRMLNSLAATHQVHYLCLDPLPLLQSKALNSNVNFSLIPFPIKQRQGLIFWIIFTLWTPIYLAYYALKFKPTRYAVFAAYYSFILILAKFIQPAPLILFLRSLSFKINQITKKPALIQIFAKEIDRLGIKNCTTLVCMTKAMQNQVIDLINLDDKKIVILPNEIKTIIPREKTKNSQFTVLSAGVIDQRKNIQIMIEAARNLPDVKFLIAGAGPLLKFYQDKVNYLKLSNLIFLGWQESLHNLFQEIDLYLHPALHEGMSNAVLEALEVGVPVLLSNTPEQIEIISDQSALFDPSDPKSLIDKIRNLQSSSSEYENLLQVCKDASSKLQFDWDGRIIEIIENM